MPGATAPTNHDRRHRRLRGASACRELQSRPRVRRPGPCAGRWRQRRRRLWLIRAQALCRYRNFRPPPPRPSLLNQAACTWFLNVGSFELPVEHCAIEFAIDGQISPLVRKLRCEFLVVIDSESRGIARMQVALAE